MGTESFNSFGSFIGNELFNFRLSTAAYTDTQKRLWQLLAIEMNGGVVVEYGIETKLRDAHDGTWEWVVGLKRVWRRRR